MDKLLDKTHTPKKRTIQDNTYPRARLYDTHENQNSETDLSISFIQSYHKHFLKTPKS